MVGHCRRRVEVVVLSFVFTKGVEYYLLFRLLFFITVKLQTGSVTIEATGLVRDLWFVHLLGIATFEHAHAKTLLVRFPFEMLWVYETLILLEALIAHILDRVV